MPSLLMRDKRFGAAYKRCQQRLAFFKTFHGKHRMNAAGTIRAKRASRRMIFSDILLTAILVWCIIAPKLTLIQFGESGIRTDDLLMVVVLFILLFRGDLRHEPRSRAVNAYLACIGVSIASALWNSAIGRVSPILSLLFVARLYQYLLFYYIGRSIARNRIHLRRMFAMDLIFLIVVYPLQVAHLLPLARAGTQPGGNTNGPYELAGVAAFFICYLGYLHRQRVMGLLAFGLIVLTEQRTAFAGAALSLTSVLWVRAKTTGRRITLAVVFAVLFFAGRAAMNSYQNAGAEEKHGSLVGRLASAASGVSWDVVTQAYNNAPVYRRSSDYIAGVFDATGDLAAQVDGDKSGLDRLFRWTTLFKSTLSSPGSILLGLGPSFASEAVDGYFTRVFVETGLIGLAVFCLFISRLLRDRSQANWPFRQYVLILVVTGCFIDIWVSYKVMLLFWLWHGMQQYRSDLRRSQRNLSATRPRALQAINVAVGAADKSCIYSLGAS